MPDVSWNLLIWQKMVTSLRRMGGLSLLLCAAFAFLCSPAQAQNTQSFRGRVVRVDSGDQIGVEVQVGGWTPTVRLHGVDCPIDPPETRNLARTYTSRRVLHEFVRVQVRGTGPNQTLYGEVTPEGGKSLNEELVRVGLATWAQQYAASRTDLAKLQVEAQNARRGIWDDVHGATVVMPTPRPTPLPATPTATPKPTETPKPIFSPSPPLSTPTAKPGAASVLPASPKPRVKPSPKTTAVPMTRPVAPLVPLPARNMALWAGFAFFVAAGATLAFLRRHAGFASDLTQVGTTAALPAPAGSVATKTVPIAPSLLCSAGAGLAAVLLVPLPFLLFTHGFVFTNPAIVSLVAVPLLFLCGHYAVAWTRREQILRSAPRLKDISTSAQNRLVKIGGQSVVASTDVVYSVVGRIPGLYMREVTSRYEAQPTPTSANGTIIRSRKGAAPCKWVIKHQDIRTADFFVTSGDHPPVRVASEWAEFYPLRIARFYNEIPVESYFNQAYVGDTRTEIHFIPPGVPVTAWGQFRQTASPVAGFEEDRMGYDAAHDCLVVVEGDPARLWTRRPLLGLLMTLAGIVLAGLVAYCLLTPPKLFIV